MAWSRSEWPEEFLIRKEVILDYNSSTLYVCSATGYKLGLISGIGGIEDAKWVGDAVIVYWKNGMRTRYYGPYGSQRENV